MSEINLQKHLATSYCPSEIFKNALVMCSVVSIVFFFFNHNHGTYAVMFLPFNTRKEIFIFNNCMNLRVNKYSFYFSCPLLSFGKFLTLARAAVKSDWYLQVMYTGRVAERMSGYFTVLIFFFNVLFQIGGVIKKK